MPRSSAVVEERFLCRHTYQDKFHPDSDNCQQNNGQEINAVMFPTKSKLRKLYVMDHRDWPGKPVWETRSWGGPPPSWGGPDEGGPATRLKRLLFTLHCDYRRKNCTHASSQQAFYMGFAVPWYFRIMCIKNTATLRDCSENSHATLCIQH